MLLHIYHSDCWLTQHLNLSPDKQTAPYYVREIRVKLIGNVTE